MRSKLGVIYYAERSSKSKPSFGCNGHWLMTSTQSGISHPSTPVTGLPPLVTLKKSKADTYAPVYIFSLKQDGYCTLSDLGRSRQWAAQKLQA